MSWKKIFKISAESSTGNASYDIPQYLRTTWTSHTVEEFGDIINSISIVTSRIGGSPDDPPSHFLGFRETYRAIEKNSMSILCVIACVDNGHDAGVISRLCRVCDSHGIPLIIGRDPRMLGRKFLQKKRVCCVAITKFGGSLEEMLPFVMELSTFASDIKVPDVNDVRERFIELAGRVGSKPDTTKRPPPPETAALVNSAKKQKKKSATGKNSFFSSFD